MFLDSKGVRAPRASPWVRPCSLTTVRMLIILHSLTGNPNPMLPRIIPAFSLTAARCLLQPCSISPRILRPQKVTRLVLAATSWLPGARISRARPPQNNTSRLAPEINQHQSHVSPYATRLCDACAASMPWRLLRLLWRSGDYCGALGTIVAQTCRQLRAARRLADRARAEDRVTRLGSRPYRPRLGLGGGDRS